jgi:hypothetical protein
VFSRASGYLPCRNTLLSRLYEGDTYKSFELIGVAFQDEAINVYGGLFCKVWDFYNKQTEVHFSNAAPYLSVGCRFDIRRFYIDTRLNQTFTVLSWCSLEHTRPGIGWFLSPWPGFIPILPTLTCTVGWSFETG